LYVTLALIIRFSVGDIVIPYQPPHHSNHSIVLTQTSLAYQCERCCPPVPQDMDKEWVRPGCLGA
jgi:hypothetical protein